MATFNVDVEFDKMMEAIGLGEMPKDDLQYTEMRKGFIGGCMAMFQTIINLQTLDDATAMRELNAISEHLMNVKL
jgi:hypothetical protein